MVRSLKRNIFKEQSQCLRNSDLLIPPEYQLKIL